jgi:hypothetical protein
MEIYHLIPRYILIACNQTKDSNKSLAGDQKSSDNNPESASSNQQTQKSGQKSNGDNPILGEWFQQYAVFDQNQNGVLDPEDRNGTKSTMGFNYFQFNEDGKCLYDSDMKFKGNYEIIDDNGKRKVHITVNGFGETYKYTIMDPVTDELVLFSSGVFMIFKRK